MKKTIQYTRLLMVIFIFTSFILSPLSANAAIKYYATILATDGLNIRRGPSTSHTKVGEVAYNTEVELVRGYPVSTNGCSSGWYQLNYNASTDAYVCGTYLSIYSRSTNSNGIATTDYEKHLENIGFPSTYWDYLTELHVKYPNWEFEAIQTNLDWSGSVAAESVVGVSLIQTAYDGYKSTASGSYDPVTKTFKVLEGSNWYAAAPAVVAYYMDPRNFLNEKNIFMFEKLNYDSAYQTIDAVRSVFDGGSMASYAQSFVTAGSTYNINPIYLASRVRQEVGKNIGDSKATTGETFVYADKTYSGLYNVYNIGATTGETPVLKGLVWANGGENGEATSYNRAWNSIEKSILGGAEMIASSYINKGQYTNYFQRFNTAPNSFYTAHTHRYMTNIKAVYSESLSTYSSYEEMNLLNNNFKFAIPVYKNMPAYTKLPSTSLNIQKEEEKKEENVVIPQIDPNSLINSIGIKTDGHFISGIYEGMEVELFINSLRTSGGSVNSSAHGYLATGDKININNREYVILLFGDLNADAKISLADLVQLKKYILGYNNLDNNDLAAADVNKDGKVTLGDLVVMKKKILKLTDISQ